METILEELNQIPDMFGSMIISKDGLLIEEKWEDQVDANMLGAFSADILGAVEALKDEKIGFGEANLITVETDKATFILKNIDNITFLAAAASPRANLGLIRIEAISASEKLKGII